MTESVPKYGTFQPWANRLPNEPVVTLPVQFVLGVILFGLVSYILSMVAVGLIEVAVEMFKHRDFKGVRYFDQPPAYDISSHFERYRPRIVPKSAGHAEGHGSEFDQSSLISFLR
jgi:hypothetical protein